MKDYNSLDEIGGQCYIVTTDNVVTKISKPFIAMTEYSKEELLNKDVKEVSNILRIAPSIDTGELDEKREYFLFTKALKARFVHISVIQDIHNKIYVFREKINSRLEERFPCIEALCCHNIFGIAVFSVPDITMLKANQTYLNFLDKPFNNRENSIGKKLCQIISGWTGSSSEDIWRKVLSTQKPFYIDEYMFEFERGITYWDASLTPIFEDGALKYFIEITTDITEKVLSRKKIEEQAKIIEKQNETLEKTMEMKEEFLSLISHELRTPLNVMYTAVQTLNLVYADEMSKKVKEYMNTIKLNINRQLRLVSNLLDITRANAGRIKINKKNKDIVLMTRSITESICEFSERKGVKITFECNMSEKIIGIDDEKYERIILNLLSNAIKFTSAGKSIVVKLFLQNGNVCIEVKDTGIGIPQDKMDVIFERFGQVDSSLSRCAEGTGIGLSLVKKLVEALGGSITVKSKLGKGTTFTILLPDDIVNEEKNEKPMLNLMNDNRLVQTINIEFSDIYS